MNDQIPEPLVDSPKCPRCSLVGICLPDETNGCCALRALQFEDAPCRYRFHCSMSSHRGRPPAEVRQLVAPRDDLRPLYLNSQGFRVGKSGEVIQVKDGDNLKQEVRLGEISQINLLGNVQLSTQAMQSFCAAEVPVCYFSQGGWFYGITTGLNSRTSSCGRGSSCLADMSALRFAWRASLVAGKIRNQRTLLQRNHMEPPEQRYCGS